MTAWAIEAVASAILGAGRDSIHDACLKAFGGAGAAAFAAWRAGKRHGPKRTIGRIGWHFSDDELSAMADALNEAGVPAPGGAAETPPPLTLAELVDAIRGAMPSGTMGQRFNALFGSPDEGAPGSLRMRVREAFCNAVPEGAHYDFAGSPGGAGEADLVAVLAVLNEAGWRPPAKASDKVCRHGEAGHCPGCCGCDTAAPCKPCLDVFARDNAAAPKVDPYQRHAILMVCAARDAAVKAENPGLGHEAKPHDTIAQEVAAGRRLACQLRESAAKRILAADELDRRCDEFGRGPEGGGA